MPSDPYVEGLAEVFSQCALPSLARAVRNDEMEGAPLAAELLAKLRELFVPREEFSVLKAAADELAATADTYVYLRSTLSWERLCQALSNYHNLTGGNDGD